VLVEECSYICNCCDLSEIRRFKVVDADRFNLILCLTAVLSLAINRHRNATLLKYCGFTFAIHKREARHEFVACRGNNMGPKKQAISVRVGEADLANLRRLAKRLGVRDSDVIRVAIKALLAKWAPLHDNNVRGRSLVPVFLENGTDLFRHFDLDTPKLDSIINEGANAESRVELEDIQLLSMSGIQRSYLRWRLDQVGSHGHAHSNGASVNGARNGNEANGQNGNGGDGAQVEQSLRQYLYEKYVHPRSETYQASGHTSQSTSKQVEQVS
jgi:hypothetical protein